MGISISQVVPWGRLRGEYLRMFLLNPSHLSALVLDCGGGPSSFAAESAALGGHVVSVDPIYLHSGPKIAARFEAAADPIISQVRATPSSWVWGFHRDPDDLLGNRRLALERFLADYAEARSHGRHVVGSLPHLPFPAEAFDLALCSHLLFLYSSILDEAFHVASALELCRVARETRVFPLLTLAGDRSPFVEPTRAALRGAGWRSEIVRVPYELQRGGNEMLRIFRA